MSLFSRRWSSASQLRTFAGVPVYIVSDASEVFINCFLKKRGIESLVKAVVTNKSWYSPGEGGSSQVLRVKPHHPEEEPPHGCPLCPPNLCKGSAIKDKLGLFRDGQIQANGASIARRILYVGDGGGDFCAAVNLVEHDIIFVRDDPTVPSARGLVRRIEREKERYPVQAQIVRWKEGKEVLAKVLEVIAAHTSSATSTSTVDSEHKL